MLETSRRNQGFSIRSQSFPFPSPPSIHSCGDGERWKTYLGILKQRQPENGKGRKQCHSPSLFFLKCFLPTFSTWGKERLHRDKRSATQECKNFPVCSIFTPPFMTSQTYEVFETLNMVLNDYYTLEFTSLLSPKNISTPLVTRCNQQLFWSWDS